MHRDAESPERFVDHDGKCDDRESRGKGPIDGEEFLQRTRVRIPARVADREKKRHFDDARDNRGERGTGDSEPGKGPDAEDQKDAERDVQGEGNKGDREGKTYPLGRAHDDGKDKADGERDKTPRGAAEIPCADFDDLLIFRIESDDRLRRERAYEGKYGGD